MTSTVLVNSIIFTFDTTIDDTTPVTVTLSPNVKREGSIGGGVVISGLMSDTLYAYTVSLVYNNISYSTQSSVITSISLTTSSVSGMDNNVFVIVIHLNFNICMSIAPDDISCCQVRACNSLAC